MTKIKICGIKTSEDAIFSASLGVDFLGLIFVRGSHRYLSISIAKKMVSRFHSNTSNHDVEIVGVFANEKLDKIHFYHANWIFIRTSNISHSTQLKYC